MRSIKLRKKGSLKQRTKSSRFSAVRMPIIAKILGHSSTRVTEANYGHLVDDATTRAMEKVFGS